MKATIGWTWRMTLYGTCVVLLAGFAVACGSGGGSGTASGNVGPTGPTCTTAAKTAPAPTTGNAANGQKVWQQNCSSCHAIDSMGSKGGPGPDLSHIGSCLTPDVIRAQIDHPQPSGGVMPSGLVQGSDEDDVVAYLSSLK